MTNVYLPEPKVASALKAHFVKARFTFPADLGHQLREPLPRQTMRSILHGVADRSGFSTEQLRGPGRTKHLAHARQEAMYLIYITGRYSLPQIGGFLGNRDHTTVLYGIRRHRERTFQVAP